MPHLSDMGSYGLGYSNGMFVMLELFSTIACSSSPFSCTHCVVGQTTQLLLLHISRYTIHIGVVGWRQIGYAHLFPMLKD